MVIPFSEVPSGVYPPPPVFVVLPNSLSDYAEHKHCLNNNIMVPRYCCKELNLSKASTNRSKNIKKKNKKNKPKAIIKLKRKKIFMCALARVVWRDVWGALGGGTK